MRYFLLIFVATLIGGCVSPASPDTTVTKDVYVQIGNGQQSEHLRDVTVNVTYEQTSTTGIESALDQRLKDMLNPKTDLEMPLIP